MKKFSFKAAQLTLVDIMSSLNGLDADRFWGGERLDVAKWWQAIAKGLGVGIPFRKNLLHKLGDGRQLECLRCQEKQQAWKKESSFGWIWHASKLITIKSCVYIVNIVNIMCIYIFDIYIYVFTYTFHKPCHHTSLGYSKSLMFWPQNLLWGEGHMASTLASLTIHGCFGP